MTESEAGKTTRYTNENAVTFADFSFFSLSFYTNTKFIIIFFNYFLIRAKNGRMKAKNKQTKKTSKMIKNWRMLGM